HQLARAGARRPGLKCRGLHSQPMRALASSSSPGGSVNCPPERLGVASHRHAGLLEEVVEIRQSGGYPSQWLGRQPVNEGMQARIQPREGRVVVSPVHTPRGTRHRRQEVDSPDCR
ncbi:MAG: hypothetical protein ACRDQX_01105, partial [Pseudonocardiaceae bacterium]